VAEGALVCEPQVWPAVGKRKPDPDVRRQRLIRRANQQLAAHAEVSQHRVVASWQPQVLTAAPGAIECPAGESCAEILWPALMAPNGPGVQHLNLVDLPAHNELFKAAADDLHLGQFWHQLPLI